MTDFLRAVRYHLAQQHPKHIRLERRNNSMTDFLHHWAQQHPEHAELIEQERQMTQLTEYEALLAEHEMLKLLARFYRNAFNESYTDVVEFSEDFKKLLENLLCFELRDDEGHTTYKVHLDVALRATKLAYQLGRLEELTKHIDLE